MVNGLCDLMLGGRWQDGKAATSQRVLPAVHLPRTITALPSYQVAILPPYRRLRQEGMRHDAEENAAGVIQEHTGRSPIGAYKEHTDRSNSDSFFGQYSK